MGGRRTHCVWFYMLMNQFCRNNALEVTSPNTQLGTGVADFFTLSVSTIPASPDATCAWERLNLDGTVTHLVNDNVKILINSQLEINVINTQLEDTGFYRCIASNGIETTNGPYVRVTISIDSIPTISGPSSFYTIATINADGDEPTDLQCAFSPFDASITVKWLHINTCNESRFIEMSDNLKYAGSNATHPSLVIYNVDARDLGRYWCQVTNLHGTISAYEIKLEKSVPPMSCDDTTMTIGNIQSSTTGDMAALGPFSCSSQSAVNQAIFKRFPDNRVPSGLITEYDGVQSSVACAFHCLQTDICISFNYQYSTGACQLAHADLHASLNTAKWDFFVAC